MNPYIHIYIYIYTYIYIYIYIYTHTNTACMNHISTHISTYPVPVVAPRTCGASRLSFDAPGRLGHERRADSRLGARGCGCGEGWRSVGVNGAINGANLGSIPYRFPIDSIDSL